MFGIKKFDAIVIGGGPGGYECAIRLSQDGLETALVEKADLGGTCLNRGCIPTKTLLHSAELYHQALNSTSYGIHAENVSFNYAEIIQRKNAVCAQLRNGIAFLEKSNGVTVFHAEGCLESQHTVKLSTGEVLEAKYIILATGSKPASLPVPGCDLPGVLDSTALLELTECPKRIVIIGGGVIGVEFATFYSQLGVEVTIIEMLDRILSVLDKDISDFMETELKKAGIHLHLGARVKSILSGLKVDFAYADGTTDMAEADVVLIAGGRKPNSAQLGLERVGVETDPRGYIKTDGLCRTNIPGIYAIGDVNGKMLLAHAASAQAFLVADHIAGRPRKPILQNRIPSCVYCVPEVASIGLTEEKARSIAPDVGVAVFNLFGNGKALSIGENKGFVKFVYDRSTYEILGFHAIGPRVTDLVAEVSAVMECEGTMCEISRAIHPHPTISEAIMEAAHICHGHCANIPKLIS